MVGAELERLAHFVLGARDGDARCSDDALDDLDGGRAHAAGGREHHRGLGRLKCAFADDDGPGRQEDRR